MSRKQDIFRARVGMPMQQERGFDLCKIISHGLPANIGDLLRDVTRDANAVCEWATTNGLTCKAAKTKVMLIGSLSFVTSLRPTLPAGLNIAINKLPFITNILPPPPRFKSLHTSFHMQHEKAEWMQRCRTEGLAPVPPELTQIEDAMLMFDKQTNRHRELTITRNGHCNRADGVQAAAMRGLRTDSRESKIDVQICIELEITIMNSCSHDEFNGRFSSSSTKILIFFCIFEWLILSRFPRQKFVCYFKFLGKVRIEKSLGISSEFRRIVKTLRKAYAGTQAAVAALPDDLAAKALKLGHIRIGWVNCHIRGSEDTPRCYRCWSPGHVSAHCKGPDRSTHCFRCGQTGHQIKDCKNNPTVYAPPRLADVEFSALLTNIIEKAWIKRPFIVAGDFNAWSTEWGCRVTRQRGIILLDALATLEAALLNTGDTPTFTGALGYSVIDLTFASDTLAPRITSWDVSELYTHSDHQAIVFEIETARPPRPTTRQSCKWNASTLDSEYLSVMMANAAVPPRPTEEMATRLMAAITSACNASMAKKSERRRRCAVYWWTSEIADFRCSCLRARRLAQRARGRPNESACQASYASTRRLLRAAIKTSKRLCWNKLCDGVNEDVWGKPYETVISRLRGPRANTRSSPTL
ncbi:unnamed protein product, partial [Trichogramma brassicae]